MTEQISLLGAREGAILVASTEPDFGSSYVVGQGDLLLPFEPLATPARQLLRGQNVLQPVAGAVDAPWTVVDGGAELSRTLNRELRGDGIPPWLARSTGGATLALEDRLLGREVPVLPGIGYAVAVHAALLSGTACVRLSFLDAAGGVLGHEEAALSPDFHGGPGREDYQRVAVRLASPEHAVSARIELVLEPGAAVLVLDCVLRAFPAHRPSWTPRPESLPLLIEAALGRAQVYTAQVELGVGTGERQVAVVRAGSDEVPVATFAADLPDQYDAEVVRFRGNEVRVKVTGITAPLSVWVDGEHAGHTEPVPRHLSATDQRRGVPVAERWCDGQLHVVEVRDESGCHVLHRMPLLLPAVNIPYTSLQSYSEQPLPFHLAPAANHRYRALRDQLARVEARVQAGQADATDLAALAQLSWAHQVLEVGFERNRDFRPLRFPEVPDPTVTVVVPVHNKFSVTYHCLAALLLAGNDVSFEVVVVDDGSSDETLQLAEIAAGVRIVRHEEAQGFVGACNDGAAVARGEYVVLLNNDTEPTVGWLDELVAGFSRFAHVGMTGARLLWPNGRVQDAGGIVWGAGDPWNYGRDGNAADPRYSYARQVDYLSGAALMIPKRIWDEVGGLSQEFAPAYFEDTDLSFKVRAAGYTTWFIPSANVYHYEGISNGTDVQTTTGLKRFQEINRPKFQAKWAHAFLGPAQGDKEQAHLEKDRGIVGRALFIDRAVPRPDKDAGSFAAIQEIRLVQSLGYKVTFMPHNRTYLGRYSDELARMGVETLHSPFMGSPRDFLEQRGAEFDVIYITRYNIAETVLDAIRVHAPQAKVLFCNADLHFLRMSRAAELSGLEEDRLEAERVREAELDVMGKVDVVLSYNEVEHRIIVENGVKTPVMTCPWVVEEVPEEDVPGFHAREGIAFLGGYQHLPNLEAVDFFLAEVLPQLRGKVPDLRFNIYGSDMPERFRALADDVINPVGWVKSVDEVYHHNRLFVAPLLSGAGIKGKVLGALAHGIPSVLSPVAAEGTGVQPDHDCVVATTAEEWAAAVATLYADEDRWTKMSRGAKEFIDQQYSFARGRELMRAAFERAGITRFAEDPVQSSR